MIPVFRECLYPWLNLQPEEDTQEALRSFLKVRNALDALLAFKISWHDYLDILESEGVDMEEYLDLAEQNTISAGF